MDNDRLARGERAIGQFNLDNIRTQLQQSGLGTTEIDARIATLSRSEDRSIGAIRSRLRERGLTNSEIDRRIDRTVFGITSSSTPPTPVLFTRTRARGR